MEYNAVTGSVVAKFPFLKGKDGNGQLALKESMRNKFKKTPAPLTSLTVVTSMKQTHGSAGGGRKRGCVEGISSPLSKKSRTSLTLCEAEDDVSCKAHLAALEKELQKNRPNQELINEKVRRTANYRQSFIKDNTTQSTLQMFPWLTKPKLLMLDMRFRFGVDVDNLLTSRLDAISDKVIAAVRKNKKCTKLIDDIQSQMDTLVDDSAKKLLRRNAAVLLLPSLFKEKNDLLYILDKEPENPTPVISLSGCVLAATSASVFMDGVQVVDEEPMTDLSLGLSVMFCLYFLFDISYPKELQNTLFYIERYLVGYNDGRKAPLTVSRVYNMLSV